MTGGLPVAYGVCEALRANQVYWAEREHDDEPLRFRQYLEPQPGEQVVLVDDILRTGNKLAELKQLLETRGATVVGLAVIIYQPTPRDVSISARFRCTTWPSWKARYYADARHCELCQRGVAVREGLGISRPRCGNQQILRIIGCLPKMLHSCAECDKVLQNGHSGPL